MLADRALPLWIGYVSYLQLVQPAPFISLLRSELDYDEPLALLSQDLGGWQWTRQRRALPELQDRLPADARWQGEVILITGIPE